jgi:predicted negative regulator of RcsB-dependent stress response
MASSLDLQEQEQVDALKAFWTQYGSLIAWTLVLALGALAAWNGWNWYRRDQGVKAGAMFSELERAAQAGDADKTGRVFGDLKQRYPGTAFAEQGGLLAARVQYDKGQPDAGRASLTWVADNATETEYRAVAQLRLAGALLDAKQYDEALKQLDAVKAEGFEALVADRRGDVLMAQGKQDAARTAWQAAWKGMDDKLDYRRLIDAKLTATGAAPDVPAGATAASGAAR